MQKPFQGIQIHHSLLGMHYAIDYVCFTSAFIPFRNKNQSRAISFHGLANV